MVSGNGDRTKSKISGGKPNLTCNSASCLLQGKSEERGQAHLPYLLFCVEICLETQWRSRGKPTFLTCDSASCVLRYQIRRAGACPPSLPVILRRNSALKPNGRAGASPPSLPVILRQNGERITHHASLLTHHLPSRNQDYLSESPRLHHRFVCTSSISKRHLLADYRL